MAAVVVGGWLLKTAVVQVRINEPFFCCSMKRIPGFGKFFSSSRLGRAEQNAQRALRNQSTQAKHRLCRCDERRNPTVIRREIQLRGQRITQRNFPRRSRHKTQVCSRHCFFCATLWFFFSFQWKIRQWILSTNPTKNPTVNAAANRTENPSVSFDVAWC